MQTNQKPACYVSRLEGCLRRVVYARLFRAIVKQALLDIREYKGQVRESACTWLLSEEGQEVIQAAGLDGRVLRDWVHSGCQFQQKSGRLAS